jgi:hypothetical protein
LQNPFPLDNVSLDTVMWESASFKSIISVSAKSASAVPMFSLSCYCFRVHNSAKSQCISCNSLNYIRSPL